MSVKIDKTSPSLLEPCFFLIAVVTSLSEVCVRSDGFLFPLMSFGFHFVRSLLQCHRAKGLAQARLVVNVTLGPPSDPPPSFPHCARSPRSTRTSWRSSARPS